MSAHFALAQSWVMVHPFCADHCSLRENGFERFLTDFSRGLGFGDGKQWLGTIWGDFLWWNHPKIIHWSHILYLKKAGAHPAKNSLGTKSGTVDPQIHDTGLGRKSSGFSGFWRFWKFTRGSGKKWVPPSAGWEGLGKLKCTKTSEKKQELK